MLALKTLQFPGAVVALAAAMTVGDAQAVTKVRFFITNPVGVCQAALPAFEGQIRKRPLAVQNEGGSNAFVTCSFTSQANPTAVDVYYASVDGVVHDVTCTGVSGYNSGSNQFVTKTATLAATGEQSAISWVPSDFTGGSSTFPDFRFSISCNVVPGVSINDTTVTFNEDVGA